MIRYLQDFGSTLLPALITLASALSLRANAEPYKLTLPTPKGLELDISFWEDIFQKYAPNQCVYHDTDDLTSVFTVRKVPASKRSRRIAIKRHKRAIRNALYSLARNNKATSKFASQVQDGIAPHNRHRSYYRAAAKRIRCQRGVDLSGSFERSRKYQKIVHDVLYANKLPSDIGYLPHLESGFRRKVRSHAGARGLWQFIKPVARAYGLRVSRNRDDRTNVRKSTLAAARLLQNLKSRHKEWPLAITAYNYGTNGMARAINKYGYNYMKIRQHHSTGVFGFAVKNYYPSLLAVRNVIKRQDLSKTYVVKRGDNLASIAERFNTSIHLLKRQNDLDSSLIFAGQQLRIN